MKILKIILPFIMVVHSGCVILEDEKVINDPIFFINQSDTEIHCIFYFNDKKVENNIYPPQTMKKVTVPIPVEAKIRITVYSLSGTEEATLETTTSMLIKQNMIIKYPFAEQEP